MESTGRNYLRNWLISAMKYRTGLTEEQMRRCFDRLAKFAKKNPVYVGLEPEEHQE